MVAVKPVPGLDNVLAVHIEYPDYVQRVVEFEEGVLITDTPGHRPKILLQWVTEHFNKTVTHVVPSHHHRDHAGGVVDYAAAGATIVVPEVAKDFYSKVNGGDVKIHIYNEEFPFVLMDGEVQFRSIWHDEAPHARDWTYAMATKACPSAHDVLVVFNADVWSPGSDGLRWGTQVMPDSG